MTSVETLWHEHKNRLRGYIAKRVGEPAVVDDILQEVFIKAYANLHKVKRSGSIAAWLYRVAANAVADHYRKEQPFEELPEQVAAPEVERNYTAELATCLLPMVDDLPKLYRDAVKLSEIEGLPQKVVAERLGISLSGAKSRIQRGREKLRQSLHDCCNIEIGRGGVLAYEPRDKSSSDKC